MEILESYYWAYCLLTYDSSKWLHEMIESQRPWLLPNIRPFSPMSKQNLVAISYYSYIKEPVHAFIDLKLDGKATFVW